MFPRRRLANLISYDLAILGTACVLVVKMHIQPKDILVHGGEVSSSLFGTGELRHCSMDEYPEPFWSVFHSWQRQIFTRPSHPFFWGLCCLLPLFQLLVHSLLRGHGTAPLLHVHVTSSLEDLLFLTTRVRVVLHVVIVRLGRPFVCETSYLRIRYCFPNNTTLCKRHYQRQGRVAKRHYPFHDFH